MRIRTSKRGLTFSFQKNETFFTGAKYRYIIDRQVSEVIILPDSEGKYQVSKKGAAHKPLIDIRNKEIRDVISNARYIEIEICDDKIIAHIVKSQIYVDGLSDRELLPMFDSSDQISFEISKEDLIHNSESLVDMLNIAGFFSAKEVNDLEYVFDMASLFSGAGLLDYPFAKDSSFDIKFACDFDKARPDTIEKMKHVRPGHNYKDIPEMAGLDRHSDTYRRLSMDKPSITIVNWRKVNIMPPIGNRTLTVAEAEALMGLPGNFKVFGSLNDRQQQIGNGVTQAIANYIKYIVKNALYAFTNRRIKSAVSIT